MSDKDEPRIFTASCNTSAMARDRRRTSCVLGSLGAHVLLRRHVQLTEGARVDEPDLAARLQGETNVRVLGDGILRRRLEQLTAHPEVDDEHVVTERQQQVLAAPADAVDL